jgi:hypothetical protein
LYEIDFRLVLDRKEYLFLFLFFFCFFLLQLSIELEMMKEDRPEQQVHYAKLSVLEMDDGDGEEEVAVHFRNPSSLITHSALDESLDDQEEGAVTSPSGQFSSIRNEYPFPISRPPSKHRDWMFGIAFVTHFIAVVVISLIEEGSLQHAGDSYERAGSWASVVMITTLLGSTFGGIAALALAYYDDSRALLLQFALIFSCIVKFLLGNIMFIMKSPYSFLGVFMIFFALWDLLLYPSTRKSLSFSSTLIQMIAQVSRQFGLWLGVSSIIVISAQTLVLLWWGAFCIGAISTMDPASVLPIALVLIFSWYWITEFFRVLLSFLVGGSILWYFVREDQSSTNPSNLTNNAYNSSKPGANSNSHYSENSVFANQIGLYWQCAFTTSFGSLTKAALFVRPSQALLHSRYLFFKHHPQLPTLCKCVGNACDRYAGFGNVWYDQAKPFHSLSLSLLAVYGRTLYRTSQDLLTYYPETMNASLAETTRFTLTAIASVIAGILAIGFGLFAEGGDRDTWPLFVLIAYLVAYAGAVLAGTVYICAVDALIVASVLNPARVAQTNQIVLLRFLRTAENE